MSSIATPPAPPMQSALVKVEPGSVFHGQFWYEAVAAFDTSQVVVAMKVPGTPSWLRTGGVAAKFALASFQSR